MRWDRAWGWVLVVIGGVWTGLGAVAIGAAAIMALPELTSPGAGDFVGMVCLATMLTAPGTGLLGYGLYVLRRARPAGPGVPPATPGAEPLTAATVPPPPGAPSTAGAGGASTARQAGVPGFVVYGMAGWCVGFLADVAAAHLLRTRGYVHCAWAWTTGGGLAGGVVGWFVGRRVGRLGRR